MSDPEFGAASRQSPAMAISFAGKAPAQPESDMGLATIGCLWPTYFWSLSLLTDLNGTPGISSEILLLRIVS